MKAEFVKSDIKLTIGLLVSNRIKYIRQVMEALKPLLEAVPCELIAVDTKGAEGDGSIDVVREYTDHIYSFTWCNDFAAARNVTLEHARGEWYMYLDDDEVFDDVQELMDFFLSGEYKNYGAGYYGVKNHKADGSENMAVVGRMVRRTKDTRFVGRVHEHFNNVYEPFKSFSCYVHHYGYYFENEDENKAHQNRNVTLLTQEIKENGYTPRMCAQLMQELLSRKETIEEGFRFFEGCIDTITKQYGVNDSCTQWMLVASIRCFYMLDKYDDMLLQAEKITQGYELNQVAQLALAGVVIAASAPRGNVSAILNYAPMYYNAWNWVKTHDKEAIPQKQLDFPKFMTQDYAVQVFQAAATCANAVKEYKLAYAYWEQLPWADPAFDGSKYAAAMQETLDGLEKTPKEPETKETPKLIKSDIKLTIGILVSNHISMIRKTMESIKPLLDAVPSELVVLDTKGKETDGSIDIVREYTDKIYPFTWCNDFSAARNALLDHASGEWFLYLDDDEYFDDVQEFIEFFNSGECEKYNAGFYYTRDYDAEGNYSTSIAGRMIRRLATTRFVGKIHETFNDVYGPNKQFNCFTHHYGYAYSTDEARKAHQQRNLSILRTELQEQGYTPRVCAQLVQELLSQEETAAEGYRFAMEALQKFTKEELKDSLVQWIMVATVRYFSMNKNHKLVLEQAEFIESNYPLNQVADLALSVVVTLSAILNDDVLSVQKYVERYMQAWEWCKEHPEEALLQMQFDFPEYLEDKYYHKMKQAGEATEEYLRNCEQTPAVKKMKRLLKGEMQGIVATLKKANRLAATPGISAEQLTGILTKCQSSAVTLGEALERHGKAGEAAICMLGEYCEALYLQSKNFGNEAVQKEFQAGIDALLGIIEKEIENLPADKKVAVFLPYKASMWDSLESVWKVADEDPDCEAYVVPIPYFDRNPDRSFGTMHYEGGQYPNYVPVYSWEEFSIPDMKPDIVFIHNPYDELNYVTSVHPAFYASNLKNYTKELVYIPYFVLKDKNLMTEETLSHLEQYCMQPGVIHAHKVIVQSEAMKEAYVEILARKFGEETRTSWDAKILGLGSPKFDKVKSVTAEDVEVPEEWKTVLYKADGSRKKIILYNTSVGALINHNEKMLAKMRDVFEVFYESRDEIALLWRPHPLIKTTIESMRPRLWEEYEKLVNEYRSASWGIYDDTADLNRAIALADAYYGDPSSLVQLCQEKGIPCMVQNVDVLNEECYSLAMENVLDGGDYWVFFAYQRNALCRMEKKSLKVERVLQLPKNSKKSYPQYGKIIKYCEKIFILPWHESSIIVYELNTGKMREILLAENKHKNGLKFLDVIIEDEKMYLLPCANNQILVLDMKTEELGVVYEIPEVNESMLYAWGSTTLYDNKVLFTELTGSNIWEVNLYTGEANTYKCGQLNSGGAGICATDNYIWLVPLQTDKILQWNKKSKKYCVLNNFPKGYKCGEKSFYKVVTDKDKIYLLPRDANMLLEIDESGVINKIDTKTETEINLENAYDRYMRYSCMWRDADKVYLMSSRKGILYTINDKGIAEENKLCYEHQKMISHISDNVEESIYQSLLSFVVTIVKKNEGKQQENETCGLNSIWKVPKE